jgi:hypothetical protein
MPDDGEDKQSELALGDDGAIKAEPVLPPVVPPSTKTPFQFNQQINIQQIPSRAWEKLSAEQIVDLTKAIVNQIEKSDERQFNWAVEQAKSSATTQRIAMAIGGLIAVGGVGLTTYLAMNGHSVVAGMIGTFLVTIISCTIGNRMFGS